MNSEVSYCQVQPFSISEDEVVSLDHNYSPSISKVENELKKTHSALELWLMQQKSHSLKTRVTSLKTVIASLKKKNLVGANGADILEMLLHFERNIFRDYLNNYCLKKKLNSVSDNLHKS